jgi:hypothetical protein
MGWAPTTPYVSVVCTQIISYKEYLPSLLGGPLPEYEGYDAEVDPSSDAFFISAAFRYGHSGINDVGRVFCLASCAWPLGSWCCWYAGARVSSVLCILLVCCLERHRIT